MTRYLRVGKVQRRVRPPTTVRPPTEAGQATLLDVTGAHEDNSASLAITLPDYATGDLVLMQVQGSQSNTITTPADFTALEENYQWGQTGGSVSWMYFVADGTQDSSYTISLSGAGKCTAIAWAVRGSIDWSTLTPEIGTSVKGTDGNPDPPAVTPSHGDGNYWIFPVMATNQVNHDSAPSGYTLHRQESQGGGQTDLNAYVWYQLVSVTTSENPGTATLSGNPAAPRWGGNTIAVLAETTADLATGDHTHVEADVTDLTHTDADAIHDNVAAEISAITAKGTPTSSDYLLIEDAADSDNKKSITIGDLPGGVSDHGALTGLGDDDHTQYILAAGTRAATYLEVSGLTGATGSSPRFVGGTTSGAPVSGTFALGDYVVTEDGNIYVCTTAGSPGSWSAVGAGAATDSAAIHDDTASEISAITAKGSPVSGDYLLIEDSEASNVKKSITIGDLPTGGGKSFVTEPGMRPPDSAGTGDVEFQSQSNGTDPSTSLFSWGNQGSATGNIINGFLVMNSATSTGLRALLKATPGAGNFEMDTMARVLQYQDTHWAGLVMLWGTPGTPTAIRAAGVYRNSTVNPTDERYVYTTYNTSWAATADDANLDVTLGLSPIYMRIEWDGTNLVYKASPAGISGTFAQITSQAEGLGRPDYVGLGVNNNGASAASIAAFSFLRFGWTADFDPTTDD